MTARSTDRARRFGLLAALAGSLFALLTLLYRTGVTKTLDREVAARLRDMHSGWLDAIGQTDDVLFRAPPAIVMAVVLAVVLWRTGPRWSWIAPLGIGVAVFADAVMRNGLGQVLHPRAFLEGIGAIFGGHYHASGSFPSGHVTRATFMAVIALAYLPRWLSIPLALVGLSVPFARMYTQSHKLIDVLGGVALGTCVALLAIAAVEVVAATAPVRRELWRSARAAAVRLLARSAGGSPST